MTIAIRRFRSCYVGNNVGISSCRVRFVVNHASIISSSDAKTRTRTAIRTLSKNNNRYNVSNDTQLASKIHIVTRNTGVHVSRLLSRGDTRRVRRLYKFDVFFFQVQFKTLIEPCTFLWTNKFFYRVLLMWFLSFCFFVFSYGDLCFKRNTYYGRETFFFFLILMFKFFVVELIIESKRCKHLKFITAESRQNVSDGNQLFLRSTVLNFKYSYTLNH